jgi:DNA polymerase III subunit alpha
MSSFVHTHVHTQFSLLQSTIKIPQLIKQVKVLGQTAVAYTDTQNMFGAVAFSKACAEEGIKPIHGTQVNLLSQGTHKDRNLQQQAVQTGNKTIIGTLNLLCINEVGYKNICKLLTFSFIDGYDHVPRIDFELLKNHSDGLIAIMPMDTGLWIELFRAGRQQEITALETTLLEIFKDNFYAELYRPVEYALLTDYENYILSRHQDNNLPIVASNAARYLQPEDTFSHKVVSAIGESIKIENLKEASSQIGFRDVCATETMQKHFQDIPEALSASVEIAHKITFDFDCFKPDFKKSYHLPTPPTSEGESIEEGFIRECTLGLEQRFDFLNLNEDAKNIYRKRLAYEIEVIRKMDFCGYFLIVSDFVRYAKTHDIPVGPGRGSGAGSLAAYSLQITDLDPIHHGLLFERFLNPERISMPDFDIDFCMDHRQDVIDYVVNKYGADKVAQIITFGKLQAKACIRDVGRVFGLSYGEVDEIAKLIPDVLNIKLEAAIEQEPTLKNRIKENPIIDLLFKTAISVEGLVRHASVHAAGIVIGKEALNHYCPLYVARDGVVTTQLDMIDLERIGLVKFDFLGLKTLTLIHRAEQYIQKHHEPKFNIARLEPTDSKTFKLICKGDTVGVFQLESPGMQDLCKKLKPDNFEDITAINALFRPGPLGSGMVDDFISRKHGKTRIKYPNPKLEPILKETYGVIVYQEQVQQIAVELANYSLGSADILRRAMGKKKPEEMANQRELFLKGTRNQNIPDEVAKNIFELMAMFAEYGFNKSHASAYAMISFHTAYLKAHYPEIYYASLLTTEVNFTDKVKRYIADARKHNIQVISPNVNTSEREFSVKTDADKTVQFGLSGIKGVGLAALDNILNERTSGGPFESLTQFCQRVDLRKTNRRVIEALIKSGGFDYTKIPRVKLIHILDRTLQHVNYQSDHGFKDQNTLFGTTSSLEEDKKQAAGVTETWDEITLAENERAHLGCYVTAHPLDRFKEIQEKLKIREAENSLTLAQGRALRLFAIVTKIKETQTRSKDTRLMLTCEDRSMPFEALCFFKNPTHDPRRHIQVGKIYVFQAAIDSVFYNRLRVKLRTPEDIQVLDDHLAEGNKFSVCLTLAPKTPREAQKMISIVKQLCQKYPGVSPCYLKLELSPDGQVFFRLEGKGLEINPDMVEAAKNAFGPKAVLIKYANATEPHASASL